MPTNYKYLSDDGVKYIFGKIKEAKSSALAAVANLKSASMQVVSTLPTGSNIETNVIYLVPSSPVNGTGDAYDEYVYVKTSASGVTPETFAWEKIGHTDIDLSGYATNSALNTLDGAVVKLTGTQTISGAKTFSSAIDITSADGITFTISAANTHYLRPGGSNGDRLLYGESTVDYEQVAYLSDLSAYLPLTAGADVLMQGNIYFAGPATAGGISRGINFSGNSDGPLLTTDSTCQKLVWDGQDVATEAYVTSAISTAVQNTHTHSAYTKSELDTLWTAAPDGTSNMSF